MKKGYGKGGRRREDADEQEKSHSQDSGHLSAI